VLFHVDGLDKGDGDGDIDVDGEDDGNGYGDGNASHVAKIAHGFFGWVWECKLRLCKCVSM
jgi:hypothetical protein